MEKKIEDHERCHALKARFSRVSCLPHWFRSLESHGCIQRIIFFIKTYWWDKYSHGRWHSNPIWREAFNQVRAWSVHECPTSALLSNKFIVCILDGSYKLTKVSCIWSWPVEDIIYLNWEADSERCCKPCLQGIWILTLSATYSDLMQSQLLFERECKFIPTKPFTYDNVSINVSYS